MPNYVTTAPMDRDRATATHDPALSVGMIRTRNVPMMLRAPGRLIGMRKVTVVPMKRGPVFRGTATNGADQVMPTRASQTNQLLNG